MWIDVKKDSGDGTPINVWLIRPQFAFREGYNLLIKCPVFRTIVGSMITHVKYSVSVKCLIFQAAKRRAL
jgi:hypothetical protein